MLGIWEIVSFRSRPWLEANDGYVVCLVRIAHPLHEFLIKEQTLVVCRQLMDIKQKILKTPNLELLMLRAAELVAIAIGEHIEHIARMAIYGGAIERLDVIGIAKDVDTDRDTVASINEHLIIANEIEVVHCARKINLLLLMVDHAYGYIHTVIHLCRADFGHCAAELSLELSKDLARIVNLLALDNVAYMVDAQN